MIDASPAFQPDRPGSPGFQLAENAGFQTQIPVLVADLDAVVTLDATANFVAGGPYHAVVAELDAVVTLDALVQFRPSAPPFAGGGVWTMPLVRREEADLLAVVTLDAAVSFRRGAPRAIRPTPRRHAVVSVCSARGITVDAQVQFRDYVRDVVIPDDEEVLVLLMGGR